MHTFPERNIPVNLNIWFQHSFTAHEKCYTFYDLSVYPSVSHTLY